MEIFKNSSNPWFRITPDLKKDAPFFAAVGLICGVVQFIGYRYFNKTNFGSELLQEHIAFNSLVFMLMFLWLTRGLTLWLEKKIDLPRTKALIQHVSERAVAFGSVAASVVIGFAIAAALFNSHSYAIKFVQAAFYFAAVAEVAANPLHLPDTSKGYFLALGMVIVTPFSY